MSRGRGRALRLAAALAGALAGVGAAACGPAEDDAPPGRAVERPGGGDTVVWGSDRTGIGAESLAALAARAPDRFFLERMADQYAGLDYLVGQSWQPGRLTGVRGLAWRRDRRDDRAEQRVEALLRGEFRERYEPVVAEDDRHAADSLRRLDGPAYERALYDHLLARHRATLAFVDSLLPRLERRPVRAAARQLRAYHQDEIAALERARGGL
ncbi:MAG TPA: hypothetical protein VFS40_08925 [Gemmatimonadales bacterium]|nr:hypothetical protein [Gemmatimonadales bacterium]